VGGTVMETCQAGAYHKTSLLMTRRAMCRAAPRAASSSSQWLSSATLANSDK